MLRFAGDEEFRAAAGRRALATAHQVAGFQTNMEYVDAIFRHLTAGGPPPSAVSLTRLREVPDGRPR
jgi:hypothetical protein